MTESEKATSGQENKEAPDRETEAAGTPEEQQEENAVPLEKMTKSQLLKEVERIQALADENYDRYLRAEADLENAKKRFSKEKTDLTKFSNESLIKNLIPVLDNLEKAIAHASEDCSLTTLVEGVELTLKGFKDALERQGLGEVNAVGEPFDPNFHEAARQQESSEVPPGTVIEEYQKGYLLNDRLIRPAMVVVSSKAS
jgi:molecular chaperone GrpE